jgi:hypothetical protein
MTPRPATLHELAIRSETIEEFGLNFTDWLHEVRHFSSRAQLQRALELPPQAMRERFAHGDIADAWLGAFAEYAASKIHRTPPSWALEASRVAASPWFADDFTPEQRALALALTPPAFKRRNLYPIDVELPLRLRAGRPVKSAKEKRESNAARQRRFRKLRREELVKLRKLAFV